jgi:tektin-1
MSIHSSVCPEDWQDFSDANIQKAERERQSSVELRTLIDGILQQTSNDMRKQCSDVNVAFNKRISETKDTKSKLEDHLNKVSRIAVMRLNWSSIFCIICSLMHHVQIRNNCAPFHLLTLPEV